MNDTDAISNSQFVVPDFRTEQLRAPVEETPEEVEVEETGHVEPEADGSEPKENQVDILA